MRGFLSTWPRSFEWSTTYFGHQQEVFYFWLCIRFCLSMIFSTIQHKTCSQWEMLIVERNANTYVRSINIGVQWTQQRRRLDVKVNVSYNIKTTNVICSDQYCVDFIRYGDNPWFDRSLFVEFSAKNRSTIQKRRLYTVLQEILNTK